METLNWKLKISVLWLIAAEAMSAHMINVTIDPVTEKLMLDWGTTINAGGWLFGAVWWLVPLWMLFPTITLKGSANRWTNFVGGILGTLLGVFHFFMCGVPVSFIPQGPVPGPTAHHILLLATSVVATVLITWYAWKWPKQGAPAIE